MLQLLLPLQVAGLKLKPLLLLPASGSSKPLPEERKQPPRGELLRDDDNLHQFGQTSFVPGCMGKARSRPRLCGPEMSLNSSGAGIRHHGIVREAVLLSNRL